ELKTQIQAFQNTMKQAGVRAQTETYMVESSDPKFGTGRGLSSGLLLKIFNKYQHAGVIVSLIGVPRLTEEQIQQLPKSRPKLIVEVLSQDRRLKMLGGGLLQAAIVSRFVFPAPGPKHPHTPREWFDRYFQIVTPANGR